MRKLLPAIALFFIPLFAYGYITNYKTWVANEQLSSTDLNGNFTKTNAALDSMVVKTALNDSINARNRTTILLPFADAWGDSFYSGDSLTVEINRKTPLGNAACLRVTEQTGVVEKIRLCWDVELPNSMAKVDSIRGSIWSVNTDGTDFLSLYVRDDSTRYAYKHAADSTGSQYSAVTKTIKVFSQAVAQSIVGGRIRVEAVVQMTNSDSMFVGPIELITTNR